MLKNKLIKPMMLSMLLPFSAQALNFGLMTPSSDTDYFYAGVKAGVAVPSNIEGTSDLQSVAVDTSYTAGVFFGRKFMDRFSAELEYMYRGKSDIDNSVKTSSETVTNSWGVSANTFMLNVTADLLTGYAVRPYVKLGAGASSNKASDYIYTDGSGTNTYTGKTSTEFAWQAGFGVNIATSQMIDTNIEYIYIDRGEFKTESGLTSVSSSGTVSVDNRATAKTGKLRDQLITVGIKFKF
jgi:opacity protein-like surface antigen